MLIEVMIAMVVLLVGVAGAAQLITLTTRMHLQAGNTTEATQLAQSKLDELMKLDFAAAPEIQISASDTLGGDVANYFDAPGDGLTRRWWVQAGPTANSRLVTMRVINGAGSLGQRTVNVTTVIRQW